MNNLSDLELFASFMNDIIFINNQIPEKCYQLSCWVKRNKKEYKSKKFVFLEENKAILAYKNVKQKSKLINLQNCEFTAGCVLYVVIKGEIDLIESFRLFCDKLYEDENNLIKNN